MCNSDLQMGNMLQIKSNQIKRHRQELASATDAKNGEGAADLIEEGDHLHDDNVPAASTTASSSGGSSGSSGSTPAARLSKHRKSIADLTRIRNKVRCVFVHRSSN